MLQRKARVSYQEVYPFGFEIALFLLYQLRNRQVRNFAPLLVLLLFTYLLEKSCKLLKFLGLY